MKNLDHILTKFENIVGPNFYICNTMGLNSFAAAAAKEHLFQKTVP